VGGWGQPILYRDSIFQLAVGAPLQVFWLWGAIDFNTLAIGRSGEAWLGCLIRFRHAAFAP
ncbi:hypothetical protein, partial [Oculatella sp. LEGE 06141]|uniref:hypothetical protein n=1 Tax=Oculatella sp. LEGE 06141 TaxID=1828648 RepID=UPI001D149CF5